MMLSLVNYGSSGESEDEKSEDESQSPPRPSRDNTSVDQGDKFNDEEWNNEPKREVKETIEKTPTCLPGVAKAGELAETPDNISSKLPAPVSDLRSIPWDQLSKLTYKSRAIRIMAPSIPEEVEEKKEKKLPSKTGSGLLAMLPRPKNEFVAKPHSLKPNNVVKKPPVKPKLIPKPKLPTPAKQAEGSDSEGDDDHVDFFSLSKPDSPVKASELTIDLPVPINDPITSIPSYTDYSEAIPTPGPNQISLQNETPNSSYFIDTSANQNETEQSSSGDFVSFQQDDPLHLDQEALAALCGSRGVKRRARNDELHIIDIRGSELTPDSQELLAKNLTADQPRVSHRKNKDGPTSQQKRKHQIMYLAHQAKEQELELQNTWANNRMTKKQTQAKYGF